MHSQVQVEEVGIGVITLRAGGGITPTTKKSFSPPQGQWPPRRSGNCSVAIPQLTCVQTLGCLFKRVVPTGVTTHLV